jgi:sigma-B regulation protein RsbU (phosphoserine phosphatase)
MNEIYSGHNNTVEEVGLKQKIADLEDKLSQQVNRFMDISRIGTVITSTFDLRQILSMVMESAITSVNAEVGQIVLFVENGKIEDTICRGITEDITGLICNKDNICLGEYLYDKKEWLRISGFGNNTDWKLKSGEENIESLIAGPLSSKKRVVGALVIANKIDGDEFDEDDLFFLEIISRFAAVAVENSYLHNEALARQKLEADNYSARRLQSMLLPDKLFENDKLRIAAYNTMAVQAGGDFYDIVQLSENRFILVVADVSNKGFPASLMMSSTRSLVRAYSAETDSLSEIAVNLNEQLCADSLALKGMFVTLITVSLDFDTREIKSINAGHPPGWVNYPDGTIAELKSGGPFMGQLTGLKYSEQVLPLKTGSRIFIYTDGIFECVNSGGRMLGISGVRSFFEENKHESPENFERKMKHLLKTYSGDPDRNDDTTYILADLK